ncbi:TPA: hypothetical protein QFP76_002534 [Enterococcus faecium]
MISNLKQILPLLKKIIIFINGHHEELEKYASYTAEIYAAVAKAAKQRQKKQTKLAMYCPSTRGYFFIVAEYSSTNAYHENLVLRL